jgi:hypothetical protein
MEQAARAQHVLTTESSISACPLELGAEDSNTT